MMTVIQPMKFWCACGEEATFFANTMDGLMLWCGECVPSDRDDIEQDVEEGA